MTEIDLQKAIKERLTKEVFRDMLIFENQEIKAFEYDLPLSSDFDDDDYEPYFPCCIVRVQSGNIKDASSPQLTTIEILVIVKDAATDMSGHKNLLITIQRIRDYFLANGGIQNKFRLAYPIKWWVNEDNTIPYFVGKVTTVWQTEIQRFNDTEKFL